MVMKANERFVSASLPMARKDNEGYGKEKNFTKRFAFYGFYG